MTVEVLLPWHREHWRALAAYISQQRIPQALIIEGREGVGKLHLAQCFAQALICTDRREDGLFCGHCHRCHLFQAGTHPDMLQLQPEEAGKAIGVDQIRALIAKLLLKPQFEAQRVVIIQPAEQLNRAAANAFLKCLEEPTERTLIVLVTARPYLLPATISSRCQKIHLGKPERQIAVEWLRRQALPGDAETLLDVAHGAPLLARAYAQRQLLALRQECFATWLAVLHRRAEPSLVAENWSKMNLAELLDWLSSWVADLIKCRHHAEYVTLLNHDIARSLHDLAQALDLNELFGFYDRLLRCKRQLSTTVNKQLMLEEILIHGSQLK